MQQTLSRPVDHEAGGELGREKNQPSFTKKRTRGTYLRKQVKTRSKRATRGRSGSKNIKNVWTRGKKENRGERHQWGKNRNLSPTKKRIAMLRGEIDVMGVPLERG